MCKESWFSLGRKWKGNTIPRKFRISPTVLWFNLIWLWQSLTDIRLLCMCHIIILLSHWIICGWCRIFHSLLWWLTGNGHNWWGRCWRQTQNKAGSPWPATAYTVLAPVSTCLWGCRGCRLGCRMPLHKQELEKEQNLRNIQYSVSHEL